MPQLYLCLAVSGKCKLEEHAEISMVNMLNIPASHSDMSVYLEAPLWLTYSHLELQMKLSVSANKCQAVLDIHTGIELKHDVLLTFVPDEIWPDPS